MFINKSVHDEASAFNNTLVNIFSNFISNEYVTIDDKDVSWVTRINRNKISLKNSLFHSKNFIEIQKISFQALLPFPVQATTSVLLLNKSFMIDLRLKYNQLART